ncbi:hypothetical protein UFOVP215_5 [uncultured Caudovirales phage]|uniref:Uncharacterized protein n=1 Tax=uncultured Caudovirales phage TaxID=2100421 RepID=A0A6J7WPM3_9CAUD|nr:hypothetical protein UFOVP215_5 [uncultured Caudovirales phage]
MEIKERNQEIYNLHQAGLTLEDLMIKYKLHKMSIYDIIQKIKNKQQVKEGYFNVDYFDCWIMPSSDERVKRD